MRTAYTYVTGLVFCLGLTLPAAAQAPARPGVPAAKPATVPAKAEYDRLLEIMVEMAWLSDPVTFPCFLEAHIEASKLQVRGFVPGRTVRDHALKLARLHYPLTVVDVLQDRPNAAVRPTRIPPVQLQRGALATLRASFPQSNHGFQVQCDSEGHVRVAGFVASFEEKLAVARSLRRLHGCTCVINATHVTSNLKLAAAPAKAASARPPATVQPAAARTVVAKHDAKQTVQKAQYIQVTQTVAPVPAPQSSTPIEPGQPYVTHGTVIVNELTPAVLQQRISKVCGLPLNKIKVEIKSDDAVHVNIIAPGQAESRRMARQIMAMPELLSYRVSIDAKRPQ